MALTRGTGAARQGLIGFAVAFLSLGLLVYVGWGEARRTYPQFQVAKLVAQAELVQNALGRHLRAGLPLRQFPGFRQFAEPILASDATLAAIAAHDGRGTAFVAGDPGVPRLDGPGTTTSRGMVRQDSRWLQVELPLRNRFEAVGALTVTMPAATIDESTAGWLPWLIAASVGLASAYGLLTAVLAVRQPRLPWLGLSYALMFGAAAATVVAVLVTLYAEGAQAKARALAASLAQRLQPVLSYGLELDDLVGLDRAIDDYHRLNPDVGAVAVLVDGIALVHSDPTALAAPWQAEPGSYQYVEPVGAAGDGRVEVAVALPSAVVWSAVARSAKNFVALFIASGLLASLFLQLGRALGARAAPAGGGSTRALELLRPIFFIAVFIESLGAGFLPQLLQGAALAGGAPAARASLAFTAYFVSFLLVLIPASQASEQRGPRTLIVGGAGLAAAALLLQALAGTFAALMLARALAGLGQGLLFIGIQTALLRHAPPGGRTRAAAIIVFGYNGGMIAGAAIGSLLVDDVGAGGVFAAGTVIGVLLALYAGWAVAAEPVGRVAGGMRAALGRLARDLPRAFGSLGFVRALLLIGAPSKAVLTGVVGFALPLLLAAQGWAAEDVGQMIMLYACGVLLTSGPMARLVDTTGRSGVVIGAGAILSGLALLGAGSAGLAPPWPMLPGPAGEVALIVAGVACLGLAHGCINAPVITYVADTTAADRLGAGGTAALYRVAERLGHVLGPVIAGQLLVATGQSLTVLAWAGIGILIAGIAFLLPGGRTVGRPTA